MLLVLHCRAARRTAARSNECFAASAWHVANNACVPAISRAVASSKLVASVLPLARKPVRLPNQQGSGYAIQEPSGRVKVRSLLLRSPHRQTGTTKRAAHRRAQALPSAARAATVERCIRRAASDTVRQPRS